ncbi:hypothetical protein BaRGS_00002937 [Batillaria attramentaria]|uniref:Alpha-type protein kinase domain-containing protein n=1 Tax=Batillaria attramentaria TaxID=370345 RepID=A0ABD0M2Y5_9CAEN
MSECNVEEGKVSPALQRIYRSLQTQPGLYESGDEILNEVDHMSRDYLLDLKPDRWPPKPKVNDELSSSDVAALKQFLVWSLGQGQYVQACGVMLLLDKPGSHVIEAAVFDDVLLYIEEQDSGHVIPPRLLIRWAKLLQNKGDLHGAIRRLNAAKSLLQGCWKSAVFPLVESVQTFRKTAGEGNAQACVISLEMTAKCLCAIPHGDFVELKEKLGFQHDDRYYQAYTMCKEAAAMAGTSELLLTRLQNQACEALLMYSAQHENPAKRLVLLESVTGEAKKSLQAHSSLDQLAHRDQFFQFVRSLFLLCLALEFSDSPQDRGFAECLEERAMFLYGEYCRQLCQKGFLLQDIDMAEIPGVVQVISMVKKEFGLSFDVPAYRDDDHTLNSKFSHSEESGKNALNKLQTTFHESLSFSAHMPNTDGKSMNGHNEKANVTSREPFSPEHEAHRKEVGLPINPADYDIPVFDVPHNIFQDLCGCKFTPVGPLTPLRLQEAAEDTTNITTADNTGSGRGLTDDSGYGPSLVLANTFLTTQLPETYGTNESDNDSGICSSCRSSSDIGSASDDGNKVLNGSIKLNSPGPVASNTVKRARLLKFNPVTGLWTSQATLVFVGEPLPLEDKLKGNCRDALEVQFLHQDEVLGRYVGKRYKRQRPPVQYLQDVTCQKTARFLVTLFNYALNDLRYDIQVVYVPVAHVQLLSREGEVEDWLNVEPYLEGHFIKLTNNLAFWRLMLVDLQGWLPREGRGVVYLTDPQFHTDDKTNLSSCDMGARGMQAFWESVHPRCNAICHALGLKRPEDRDCTPV